MVLNGSLQVASAMLMVGLAGWTRGWCRRNKHLPRNSCPTGDHHDHAQQVGGDVEHEGPAALVGGALLAAGIPEEEPPGTVPDLTVELSHVSLRCDSRLRKRASLDTD